MYSTCLCFFFCFPEIEAKEACDWLRAAGFPQYAQLYEGNTHIHTRDTPRVVSIYPAPLSHTKTCMFNSAPGFLSLTPCIIFSIISVSFSFPTVPPSSYPLLLARCFLFPGFSSCPERWVMGKALLSLLGLAELFSLHSSTFLPLPCPFLPLFLQSPPVFQSLHFLTVSFFLTVFLSSFLPSVLPSFHHARKHNHRVSYS